MPVSQLEIGEHAYLFKQDNLETPKTTCVITAHGLQAPTFTMPMRLGHTGVELHYFVPHGRATTDVGLRAIGTYTPHERLTPDESPDYLLSKYTNSDIGAGGRHRHNTANETYDSARYSAGYMDFDIITIRSRGVFGIVLLSTVLKDLWSAGHTYQTILCSFCRGIRTDTQADRRAARHTG